MTTTTSTRTTQVFRVYIKASPEKVWEAHVLPHQGEPLPVQVADTPVAGPTLAAPEIKASQTEEPSVPVEPPKNDSQVRPAGGAISAHAGRR